METSLIIATYNWPEALELVLLSVLQQSKFPDEIIIADDGSTNETKQIIELYTKKFHIALKHIWQADNGFQKTSILNKGIAIANSDYIIQIDGDIVLHPHFIKDHIQSAQQYTFIHGSRALLNQEITSIALQNNIVYFPFFHLGIKNRLNLIYSPILSKLFGTKNTNLNGTRGCNFSFWKKDFICVNGYNEQMIGWGKEDTELSVRLMNKGLQKYKLKFKAICYHLHHHISSREELNINNTILNETISTKKTRCNKGINQYANRD